MKKDGTVSFVEYQVTAYQKKIKELEEKIRHLVTVGQENEKIFEETCHLTEELLKNQAEQQFFEKICNVIEQQFRLQEVVFKLRPNRFEVSDVVLPQNRLTPENAEKTARLFNGSDQPICGMVDEGILNVIFKAIHPDIKSSALVPLIDTKGFLGVFALGSSDPEKFFHGMGTLFLTFLGRVLTYLITSRLEKHGRD